MLLVTFSEENHDEYLVDSPPNILIVDATSCIYYCQPVILLAKYYAITQLSYFNKWRCGLPNKNTSTV